jgi:hypothetical protein
MTAALSFVNRYANDAWCLIQYTGATLRQSLDKARQELLLQNP